MTVATQTTYEKYEMGDTSDFPFSFHCLDPSHVKVFVNDVEAFNFTVTLNANQETNPGGVVNFVVATMPEIGSIISIERHTPIVQSLAYPTASAFPAESHEAALDLLTLIAQEGKNYRNMVSVVTGLPAATEAQVGRLVLLRTPDQTDKLYICAQTAFAGEYAWYEFPRASVDLPTLTHLPTVAEDWLTGTGGEGYTAELWANTLFPLGGWQLRSTLDAIPAGGVWQFGSAGNPLENLLTFGLAGYRLYVKIYHPTAPGSPRYTGPVDLPAY